MYPPREPNVTTNIEKMPGQSRFDARLTRVPISSKTTIASMTRSPLEEASGLDGRNGLVGGTAKPTRLTGTLTIRSAAAGVGAKPRTE